MVEYDILYWWFVFTHQGGKPKILKKCKLPLTGTQCVNTIITEKGVFQVDPTRGLTLTEIADGVTVQDIVETTDCEFEVAKDIKSMGQI